MLRKTKRNVEVVSGYTLSTELARVAQLPVGSTVCRTHWDEIRRNSERCSVPRASHSRILRKPSIPTKLFAVLDAVGRERKEEYRPGTRCCTECSTQVDKEAYMMNCGWFPNESFIA